MSPSISAYQVGSADVMANAVKTSLDDVIGTYQGRKITAGGKNPSEAGLDLNDPTKFLFEPENEAPVKSQPRQAMDNRAQKMRTNLARQYPELQNSGALARFFALLRKTQREQDTSELAEELENIFPDPSVRFGVVQSAAADLGQGGGDGDHSREEIRKALSEYGAKLESEHGSAILAGNNIAPVLNQVVEGGGRPEDAGDIREFYRTAVFDYKAPADSYRYIVDNMHRFSGEKDIPGNPKLADGPDLERGLGSAIDFLTTALSADLAAVRPSGDPLRLNEVVDGIQQVRLLGNAHNSCRDLMIKFHNSTDRTVPVAPYRLMTGMLDAVKGDRVTEGEFISMARDFNLPPHEPSINFLTQFRDIVGKLPPRVYEKPESRERVLDSMQRAVDHLIDQEEASLG